MKWRSKEAIKEAKEIIKDEGVFSSDQILILTKMLEKISDAIDHNETPQSFSGQGHGY